MESSEIWFADVTATRKATLNDSFADVTTTRKATLNDSIQSSTDLRGSAKI